jgi:hypothetical protein
MYTALQSSTCLLDLVSIPMWMSLLARFHSMMSCKWSVRIRHRVMDAWHQNCSLDISYEYVWGSWILIHPWSWQPALVALGGMLVATGEMQITDRYLDRNHPTTAQWAQLYDDSDWQSECCVIRAKVCQYRRHIGYIDRCYPISIFI